jgi:hypothetical protein
LNEPFFATSVQKLRADMPPAPERESEIATIEEVARHLPPAVPVGIVFHMSRCGSTLLTNGLRTAECVVALSESQPIDRVLQMVSCDSDHWATIGRSVLPALITLFANYQGSPSRKVVIKTGVTGIISLPAIRALWPDVPCVIVIRNPIEVLVSNLQTRPRWLVESYLDPALSWFGAPPPPVASSGIGTFCAWMIGRFCEESLNRLDDRCAILDYEDITPNAVRRIGEQFGLSFAPSNADALIDVFRRNAKHLGQQFEQDRIRKQASAAAPLISASDKWVSGPYTKLAGHRRRYTE